MRVLHDADQRGVYVIARLEPHTIRTSCRAGQIQNGPRLPKLGRSRFAAVVLTDTPSLLAQGVLEKRGITKEERQRMHALLNIAQGLASTAPTNTATRLDDLRALRAWYDDWAETARTVMTRRDYLIRLGLAKRKKSAKPAKLETLAPTTP